MRYLLSAVVLIAGVCVSAFSGAAPGDATASGIRVGAEAVWNPDASFRESLGVRCGALSFPRLGECLARVMKDSGASKQALAFTRCMDNEAWLRAFRDSGTVDIAYVTYPFRANENQGVLLVNGSPALVDVDDFSLLDQDMLKKDSLYAELSERYPEVSLWPGDRFLTLFPVSDVLPRGGRRFYVSYLLRNSCHACETVGSAQYAFDFDAGGVFVGTKLMGVTALTGEQVSDPARPVAAEVGRDFSLVLRANPTTGYGWIVAKIGDDSVIQWSGKEFKGPKSGLMGAGGVEFLRFRALRKGATAIVLHYVRPWEKGKDAVREAAFMVVVR